MYGWNRAVGSLYPGVMSRYGGKCGTKIEYKQGSEQTLFGRTYIEFDFLGSGAGGVHDFVLVYVLVRSPVDAKRRMQFKFGRGA